MIIGKNTYCDDCGDINATKYYVGFVIRYYCDKCANNYRLLYIR